jgi:hypothetical protein
VRVDATLIAVAGQATYAETAEAMSMGRTVLVVDDEMVVGLLRHEYSRRQAIAYVKQRPLQPL